MIAYVAMIAAPLALAAWWMVRWYAWRARHESIVRGVVDADAPPVILSIDQQRVKALTGDRGERWEPQDAKIEAHPFTLIEADGTRVHVEPDERSDLLWAAQETVKLEERRRRRITRVRPGMTLEILGALERGFEGDGPFREGVRARLVPPRWGDMLFSIVPLAPLVRKMASAYAKRALMTLGFALVIHAISETLWRIDLAWSGATLESIGTIGKIARYAVGIGGGLMVIVGWDGKQLPWARDEDEIEPRKQSAKSAKPAPTKKT